MDTIKLDPKAFPETVKFQSWFEAEKANGLVDVKFFIGKTEGATIEQLFSEANAILSAEEIDDPEFF